MFFYREDLDMKKPASQRLENDQRIIEKERVSDSGQKPISHKFLLTCIGASIAVVAIIIILIIVLR